MPAASPSAAAVPHAHAPADLAAVVRLVLAGLPTATPPELLDLAAVLSLTAQSKSSIYRGIAAGTFPAAVDTPSGRRWKRKDVLRWIERLT